MDFAGTALDKSGFEALHYECLEALQSQLDQGGAGSWVR
jgi:hypothetical protein